MVRSFLAIDLSPEARGLIASHLKKWRRLPCRIKWVAPENLHVTLKFMGDVSEAALPLIQEALRRAVTPFEPLDLEFSSTGAFPVAAKARVLWVGISRNPALDRLAAAAESALAPLGFEPESRPFHPHITVGRVKERFSVYRKIHPFFDSEISGLVFHVSEVVLYRSDLAPAGPRYSPICRFPLSGGIDQGAAPP